MPNHRFLSGGASRPRQFKVVVAFDGAGASSSALKTCEYVIQQLGEDIQVRRKIIDLNRDMAPRSRAAAARDAARADMVIVSTRDEDRLSVPMQQWMDQWAPKRSADEGALVAILTGERTHTTDGNSVRSQLAHVAQKAHMDFFSSEVTPA
jgi:hypothetical protein